MVRLSMRSQKEEVVRAICEARHLCLTTPDGLGVGSARWGEQLLCRSGRARKVQLVAVICRLTAVDGR